MTEFLVTQSVNCLVLIVATLLCFWRYRRRIGRMAQRRMFQYRMFALRDRAIRMIAEGVIDEDDEKFQSLYAHLNDSARTVSVDQMQNGLRYVLGLLKAMKPPTSQEMRDFLALPDPVRQLCADFVSAVLSICWEGSFLLRLAIRGAQRFKWLKDWLKQLKPVETAAYRRWELCQHHIPVA